MEMVLFKQPPFGNTYIPNTKTANICPSDHGCFHLDNFWSGLVFAWVDMYRSRLACSCLTDPIRPFINWAHCSISSAPTQKQLNKNRNRQIVISDHLSDENVCIMQTQRLPLIVFFSSFILFYLFIFWKKNAISILTIWNGLGPGKLCQFVIVYFRTQRQAFEWKKEFIY